jgi:hypothetical protein
LILEGQGQARLHLKPNPSWSHEWGPVHSGAIGASSTEGLPGLAAPFARQTARPAG